MSDCLLCHCISDGYFIVQLDKLNLSVSYINISNPKYIIAPAIFPFAGSFVGANTIITTSVLNTQAHIGRLVFLITIMINNVTINVSNPR